MAFAEHRSVLSSTPTQAEIEREDAQIGSQMVALVASEASEEILVAALNRIPELGSIKAEAFKAEAVIEVEATEADAIEADAKMVSPAPAQMAIAAQSGLKSNSTTI